MWKSAARERRNVDRLDSHLVSFVWLISLIRMSRLALFGILTPLGESVRQGGNMHLKLAPRHIVDIAAQGIFNHGEGDLVPGNSRE